MSSSRNPRSVGTEAQRGTIPGSTWNDAVPLFASTGEAARACADRPAVTQFTRWERLETVLRGVPDETCDACPAYVPTAFSATTQERVRRATAPFRTAAPRNNATLLACARWAWDYARSAVLVCRRGENLWFLPFCNRDGFVNLWDTHVVQEHLESYAQAFRPGDRGEWLSPSRMWSNGTMLCTHNPKGPQAMSDRGFTAWLHMLQHTLQCHRDQIGDFTVFLNKRDAPLLRTGWRLGTPIFDPFAVSRDNPVPPDDFPAVLSAYANPKQADDVPFPSPQHWASTCSSGTHPALRPLEPPPYVCVTPWDQRENKAVFRGSLTSPERVHLVLGADPSVLDSACTGLGNKRLKVENNRGQLRIAPPVDNVRAQPGAWMPQQAMFDRYRYVVTCDGHGAADREFDYLRASGCVVLKYEPEVSGKAQWYDAVIATDGTCDGDPIVRCRTMRQLNQTIAALQTKPELAMGFAACASAFGHRYLRSGTVSEYVALVLGQLGPVYASG